MKEIQDLYTESYKTLKEDVNKKTFHVPGLKHNAAKKVMILPKLIYKLNAIGIRIPPGFLFVEEIDKLILKFIWDPK